MLLTASQAHCPIGGYSRVDSLSGFFCFNVYCPAFVVYDLLQFIG